MKPIDCKPVLLPKHGDDILLDNRELISLMKAVLSKEVAFRFRAKGWSMSPFIRDGDWITVTPPFKEPPSIGKVAAFIHPISGRLIVHRLVGKQGSAYLIRGDNVVGQADGLAPEDEILGCVTRVERGGKRVYLGLGVERYLIAWISKIGFLTRLLNRLRRIRLW